MADGCVVFVNQDDHRLLLRARRQGVDGSAEVGTRKVRVVPCASGLGQCLLDATAEVNLEGFKRLHFETREVEVEDGIGFPVVVHLVDGQTLEELALAAEETLQGREHQRLTETPWTGDEEEGVHPTRDERVEQRGLIHIAIAILPHIAEVVGSLRNLLFFHGRTPSP